MKENAFFRAEGKFIFHYFNGRCVFLAAGFFADANQLVFA